MSKVLALKLKNELKRDMKILETLDVLKRIAIAEFRHCDMARRGLSKFMAILATFFHFYRITELGDALVSESRCKTPCVVAISSDKGFLGALNTKIIDYAAEKYFKNSDTVVIVLGKHGARRLKDLGVPAKVFPGLPFPLSYEHVMPLKQHLLDMHLSNRIGDTEVVYSRCHSFTKQTLGVAQLLPFGMAEEDLEGIDVSTLVDQVAGKVIVEPDIKRIQEYTGSLWLGRRLFEIFWDSKVSEMAGRAIDLTERHDRLRRYREETQVKYFRVCHEVVDTGIREIFASHNFAKKGK